MEYNSLKELVLAVYDEIKFLNTQRVGDVVPISTNFTPMIEKKYGLKSDRIPELITILSKSKMIFSFPVTHHDSSSPDQKHGYVVTHGDIIQVVRKRYEELFERAYTDEFHKKVPVEKLIIEFTSKRNDFNDQPLGILASIVTMLQHYQSLLERNILQYSEKIKEKALDTELEGNGPVESYFIIQKRPDERKKAVTSSKTANDSEITRRAVDVPKYDELKAYTSSNSMEKTLKLYGIEFYTRVCFREYRFSHIQKVIEDGFVRKPGDLKSIKVLLEKERMNSDKDIRINEYATDINKLMKCINDSLKGK